MEMLRLELRMHPEMLTALQRIAKARDVTAGQVLRDLAATEIRRQANAKPPVRADERLLAPLRARLAPDLAHARGWDDLGRRLRAKGYCLQPAGGGLALHDSPDNRRICKASELGFSYARLMHRFRAPYPGHPHHRLFERIAETETPPPDDGVVLIDE